jgi:hypothetical protein
MTLAVKLMFGVLEHEEDLLEVEHEDLVEVEHDM